MANHRADHRNRAAVVCSVLLLIGGCSAFRINTEYERGTSFAHLRTYAWRDAPPQGPIDPRINSTMLGQRVRATVDRELGKKGYRLASAGERPDFLVGYHAVLKRKVDVRTLGGWYGYRGGGPRMTGMVPYEYDEGTLLIDVIAPDTKDLLWRGSATAVVDPGANAERREARIDDAVTQVLARFPPQ
jgi:hypothetical protein